MTGILQSEKLKLRAVEPSDADFMYEMENDSECWRYGETVAPLSRTMIRDYALNYDADPFSARQLRMVITDISHGTYVPVGVIDLYEIDPIHRRAFIGLYVLPLYRGKGYATSALQLLQRYALLSLRLRLLAARVESLNPVSLHLFEKSGFVIRATIPDWFIQPDGTSSDLVLFTRQLSSAET